jgi:hypothetical protein
VSAIRSRGFREVVLELYASESEAGRELIERVARMVPAGPTHFVRDPGRRARCEQVRARRPTMKP